jgi:uncharacterized membrane protein
MDIANIFVWWLTFFLLGAICLPITTTLFRRFFDLGYGFAKTVGLFLVSYLVFLGATLRLIPFSQISLIGIIVFIAGLNFLFIRKGFFSLLRQNSKILVFQEALFAAGLVLWSYIRSFAPDIRGLEKFMDFGFINSILQSKYLPAPDMWFAGEKINYYWFGHLFSAVPVKLTGISPAVAYNLMLATILGMLLVGVFSIVATLVYSLSKKYFRRAVSAGAVSAILTAFAGNLHTPIYLIKKGLDAYWYPDATRFVGYFPETLDKTIHEFPIYSFVVSDLHAHFLDIPLTLLFLAILYAILAESRHLYPKIIGGGLLLGAMIATNSWDFASYSLVAGLVFLIWGLIQKKDFFSSLLSSSLKTLVMAGAGVIFFLPFILTFAPIAQGIQLVHSHTPLWQLGVLWGFPAITTAIFVFTVLKFIKGKLKRADGFILAILAASWILVVIPEIIFVKDIYIASHYRANTMFKLTYQAYIMFYLAAGYVAIRLLGKLTKVWKFIGVGFFALVFTSLLIYPFLAVNSYYGGLKNYSGLSGETWVEKFYPESYQAILWLRANVKGQAVVLETPGNSYTDNNLVSSYTGLPTVQGWFVHEWLWRGTAEAPQQRVNDITTIYQSEDVGQVKPLLAKHQIRYVLVGAFERERFPTLNEEKFLKLGKKVFASGETAIYLLDN